MYAVLFRLSTPLSLEVVFKNKLAFSNGCCGGGPMVVCLTSKGPNVLLLALLRRE